MLAQKYINIQFNCCEAVGNFGRKLQDPFCLWDVTSPVFGIPVQFKL